ncbi:MAG: 5'/3'-nucleotidase SurE [Alphaproteobacteria bacterium]
MRILITNDDGINAEGLKVLEEIAATISDDVWVVAPEVEQSGASRALTLSELLRVRKISERRFAVRGTPTDAVMLAVQELMPLRPDLVLSGVNRGQNIAEDVSLSGTVAGAIQGMALGIPAIAFSQAMMIYRDDHRAPFEIAREHGPGVVRRLLDAGWPKDVVLNVNFPDPGESAVKGLKVTRQGFRDVFNIHFEKREDLRGGHYYWMGFHREPSGAPDGSDIHAVYDGWISVSPLHIDLTHEGALKTLSAALSGSS